MNKFFYWLARQLRPFQSLPLSDRLTSWNVGISRYLGRAMQHAAHRSQSFGFPCGIVEVIGVDYLDAYTNPDWQPETPQDAFPEPVQLPKLQWLAERVNLQPWTDFRRFAELQEKYLPLLKLPPAARD